MWFQGSGRKLNNSELFCGESYTYKRDYKLNMKKSPVIQLKFNRLIVFGLYNIVVKQLFINLRNKIASIQKSKIYVKNEVTASMK